VHAVETKIKDNEVLSGIGSRKVYDRIRSEIRRMCEKSEKTLPVECDTAAERVARMFSYENNQISDKNVTVNEDSDSECVAPSTTNHLFAPEDVNMLLKLCDKVIVRGSISDIRIHDELNKTSGGWKLMKKSSAFQIKNRIKYERRKIVQEF